MKTVRANIRQSGRTKIDQQNTLKIPTIDSNHAKSGWWSGPMGQLGHLLSAKFAMDHENGNSVWVTAKDQGLWPHYLIFKSSEDLIAAAEVDAEEQLWDELQDKGLIYLHPSIDFKKAAALYVAKEGAARILGTQQGILYQLSGGCIATPT